MLMSVCFTCLCNSTHRKLLLRWHLVALVNDIPIYVPAEVMPVSVFVRHAVAVSCYMAELQDRAPLQAQSAIQFWLDRESRYKRLSQLALDLVASPASQAYVERLFSLCGDLTARKRNRTRVSLPV